MGGERWNNSVVEFTPAQLAATGTPTPAVTLSATAGNSLEGPDGLAFDPAGDLWVANFIPSVVEFTPAQLATTGSPTPAATIAGAGTGLSAPFGIAVKAAPAAPVGVSAAPGNAQVNLSWGAVAGASSYEAFDATSPGAEAYTGAPACTTSTTSCTVGSLANGTKYYFTVEALGAGGTSTPSGEVSATPVLPMPATAGATTTAVATSTALRSSANPSAAGAPVIYTATVSPAPNGNSVSFSDNGVAPPGCGAVAVSTSTGQASCSVSYASAGSHTVTAAYSGDATFSASASVPLNQVVSEASFPTAGASYPNGAIVGFAGADYVLAGGRAFGAGTAAGLRAVQKVDPARVVAAPAGATAPTGVTPRPGTLVSTRAVDANPTVYVVGTSGDLYGFAGPAQFVGAGFDPALVVTVPSLGGLKVSATSAGAAGLTAFSTSADGAIVDSGGAYYVFAGGQGVQGADAGGPGRGAKGRPGQGAPGHGYLGRDGGPHRQRGPAQRGRRAWRLCQLQRGCLPVQDHGPGPPGRLRGHRRRAGPRHWPPDRSFPLLRTVTTGP